MIIEKNKELELTEKERCFLENRLNELIVSIGPIPIANKEIMPFGWRKAAKGRTVWRILEEIINQNLEKYATKMGFTEMKPADSEVGVYDFLYTHKTETYYVNIKSSVKNGRKNKDDISKAKGLLDFYHDFPSAKIYIATFVIDFQDDMTISIDKCVVCPLAWISDIYVNPSNNGNLQSANYKFLEKSIKRTNTEFINLLKKEYQVALSKKKSKQ